MSTIANICILIAGLGALAAGVGFVGMLLTMAFDSYSDWFIKPMMVGLAVMIAFGVPALALAPATPLSRGIVADKRERHYTTTVMAGHTPIITQHVAYELISTEGARCEVSSEAFAGYRSGDAIMCGWSR